VQKLGKSLATPIDISQRQLVLARPLEPAGLIFFLAIYPAGIHARTRESFGGAENLAFPSPAKRHAPTGLDDETRVGWFRPRFLRQRAACLADGLWGPDRAFQARPHANAWAVRGRRCKGRLKFKSRVVATPCGFSLPGLGPPRPPTRPALVVQL